MISPTSAYVTGSSYTTNNSEITNRRHEEDRTAQFEKINENRIQFEQQFNENLKELHEDLKKIALNLNQTSDLLKSCHVSVDLLEKQLNKIFAYYICAAVASLSVAGYLAFRD